MKNIDSIRHLRGESIYIDDIPTVHGTLYGLVIDSTVAHGKIIEKDFSAASDLTGVIRIIDYHEKINVGIHTK